MNKADSGDTVSMILSENMIRVIDIFRDIHQNFEVDDDFLLGNISENVSLSHLFSNLLSQAEDEIVMSALGIYKTCISDTSRIFQIQAHWLAIGDLR